MLNFDAINFDYDPYPIGMAPGALAPELYEELIDTFPDDETFVLKEFNGVKYSLSRHNNKAGYFDHLRKNAAWGRFYDYIDSERFITDTMTMLRSHNIDLALANSTWRERAARRFKALRKGNRQPHIPRLRSRFEFSSMPVTGGNIRPHTDHPSKVVTMVIPILRQNEWNEDYGGGTSVVWPKDRTSSYNLTNAYVDFDEVDCVRTYPFEPNQCLVFVKTYNSWHAVWPMTGNDPSILRRTLTINIESE